MQYRNNTLLYCKNLQVYKKFIKLNKIIKDLDILNFVENY